ncbi:hypothetical protein [Streptomyces sp. NBC_00140]|uniref:hypothetical protein n=1 Tax=Streptomyces sp. NBC_00140 TaxID=2975664 RepID=UPI00224D5EA1|nr:hypothetical protein [Streptomyces sp. NBC_00140]MCX5338287.1 hypothetical protein [Streptomyces sp. NBC_00140]
MSNAGHDREQNAFDAWEARVAEEITTLLTGPVTTQEALSAIQRQAKPASPSAQDADAESSELLAQGGSTTMPRLPQLPVPYSQLAGSGLSAESFGPVPTGAGGPSKADGLAVSMRIPAAAVDFGTAGSSVKIGLWGAPRSGKTTYLAALPIAAMQYQRHGEGTWQIGGMTHEASQFLINGVTQLAVEKRFPSASVGLQDLSWAFQGQEPASGVLRKRREPSFVLDIHDTPGEAFSPGHALHAGAVDHLAQAQGLIYFFDPLGDAAAQQSNLTHFFATLNELNTRVKNEGGHYEGRLPHYVSVCIAKFDHPEIFRPAVEAGWVTQDTVGSQLPRVPAHLAEGYFQWLCNDWQGSTAQLVRDGLSGYFHAERIKYYVTSSVGFRLNRQHIFDYRNYANVEFENGAPRIHTSPEPINVLEPLTDLERRIRPRRRGWRR